MGGSSSKTTSKTVYGDTTTQNPYVIANTNNYGTTTSFKPNTAFNSINDYVNKNIDNLLNEYLNPSLNSVTNQAKLKSFNDNLNNQTYKNLENNIINPLSNRNMIRSSQATNMYNNLVNTNANAISNYANNLLANTQTDTAAILNTLMSLYMKGYNAITDAQHQSLATSQGNAERSQETVRSDNDLSGIVNAAVNAALKSYKPGSGII